MSKPKQKKKLPGKTGTPVTPVSRKSWILLLIALAITLFLYYPTVNFEFVNWDDDINITLNKNVEILTTESVKQIFSSTVIGGYTPLTTLSFAVENHFLGMDPWHFHLLNIIFHLICTALVFFFLRQLGFNPLIVFTVTLLFGIHPMRVESVAWVTERKDVLYSTFFLLALIFYTTWLKTGKKLYYLLSLLVFILSLLSKIQAVSLPLALILVDYFHEKKFTIRQILNKIPFFLLSLITGLAGIYFLKEEGSLETDTILPFVQRIFIGTYSLCVYIVKSLVPWEMSAIYPFPAQLNAVHYISMPVLLLVAFLIWKIRKFRTEIIFGTLFFLVNVVFMIQVVGAGQGYIADRFTYIPYIGLFLVFAFLADRLATGNARMVVIGVGVVYLLILGVVTHNRVKVWQNSETLFTDVIEKYPRVPVAYNNMGRYFRELKQYDKAIASYNKALEIKSDGYMTLSNRGKAYFDIGQNEKALADFNKSIELNDKYPEALSNRGAVLSSKQQFEAALKDLDRAISLEPGLTTALSNRALTYYTMNLYEKSAADITTYLQYKPGDADMINLRALCYSQLNRDVEAMADYNRAIELLPTQGIFWQNRSFYLNKKGDKAGALRDIRQAERLGIRPNPDYMKMLEQ